MLSNSSIFVLLSLAADVCASWSGNLNFGSPSHIHPALGIALPKVVKRNAPDHYDPAQLNFTHGVASGDPLADSVILWTRASPTMDDDPSNITVTEDVPLYSHETKQYVLGSKSPICVDWKVAKDDKLRKIATKGQAYTSSDIDYTIKVNARGLEPFTTYYYQFNVCHSNITSPIGRTKTAPGENDDVSQVNLAVFSCSNFPFGYFNTIGNSARRDMVDYVVHLGDYIYEYANGDYGDGTDIGRIAQPDKTLFTLYDYRRRLATYRTDLDMLLSHQKFAWIPTWDDHEVADNTWMAGEADLQNTEDSFNENGGISVDQRKMNAVRAYFEWMPIRQVEMDDNLRIWRTFKLGKLVDLIMLDTRQYERSVTDLYFNTHYISEIKEDAGRSLMGARQEGWFYDELTKSHDRGATWRIIGSQIVFSQIDESFADGVRAAQPFNLDAWNGYESNRNRTLEHLYRGNISNNIMIAGDSHVNWVSDLTWLGNPLSDSVPYNEVTGAGSLGAEFAGTAISSPTPYGGPNAPISHFNGVAEWLVKHNPELQWQESYYRGYFEMYFTPQWCNASFFGAPMIKYRNPYEIPLANFSVKAGENRLQRPVGKGKVEDGAIKVDGDVHKGIVTGSNMTNDTSVPGGRWFVGHFYNNME
ncbi:MAG: hypothetical protein M1831_001093 [Alyxoria varia]|nr:MAG: hypothetical protein M1831_001093 [Alyxoria varia]